MRSSQSIFWEYLTKPEYRAIMLGASEVELRNRAQGRTAVDSVYYCYYPKSSVERLFPLALRAS